MAEEPEVRVIGPLSWKNCPRSDWVGYIWRWSPGSARTRLIIPYHHKTKHKNRQNPKTRRPKKPYCCGTMVFYPSPVLFLIKCWLASSQAESIGEVTRQEVEAGQWEQENSGKRKDSVFSCHPDTEEEDENASLKKVPSLPLWLTRTRIMG